MAWIQTHWLAALTNLNKCPRFLIRCYYRLPIA